MLQKPLTWIALSIFALVAVMIIVPGLLVSLIEPAPPGAGRSASDAAGLPESLPGTPNNAVTVPVFLSGPKQVVSFPLEQYVLGVVAAEMPIDFELEALKAQAIAARTYIVRKIADNDFSKAPAPGAWVSDTVLDQAFVTDEQLKKRWGTLAYKRNMSKLTQAVSETAGQIATYEHRPIVAAYFSTSTDRTENSEDYWSEPVPYLRSVPSPWDKSLSPRFTETVKLTNKQIASGLGLVSNSGAASFQVLDKTGGGRIAKVRIGGKTFTGREVREKLGLNSALFTWKPVSGGVDITTYGYGHGIGMSQWGANGLAKEGKSAEDILKYYYKGISIESMDPFVVSKS